ncbi:MAG: TAT-variant-translocated molybdopterin oxidoreductase [Pseudobdellovibrionaceae bacterium]|nr:TAT-variant-translocated molybdopterin oxidoreductase [Bdellovibrionales bacterium]USN47727.1 MAG: TAT-variant-translocated molybdopterin oxidoreductase [Pseudobdellovibrionaceae bacterium]
MKDNSIESSRKYWLSLDEWYNDPETQAMVQKEFLSTPLSEDESGPQGGVARREFLKLMGAGIALSSFGCVRRPAQKIVPYAKRPKEMVPGIANYYASSMVDGHHAFGLVVTTREGRPIKLDGNKNHPVNAGGMTARAHAKILSLYDPDRMNGPKRNLLNKTKTNRDTINVTWEDLDKAVGAQLQKGGVALLTASEFSPSTRALVGDFVRATNGRHFQWDALSFEAEREGQKLSYGDDILPRPRFDRAKMIVAIDNDFLGTYLSPAEFNRAFASGRTPGEGMSRLVVFESLLSLTGSNADERFRIKPSQQVTVVMALLQHLLVVKGVSSFAGDSQVLQAISSHKSAIQHLGVDKKVIGEVAESLWAHRGESLVVAGGLQSQTASAVGLQVAVNLLNSVLENDGRTVDYKNAYPASAGSHSDIKNLVDGLNAKTIKTVIIHGVNPGYSLGAQSGFVDALKNAEMVVYTGDRIDETGVYAEYVAPDSHTLEKWGDLEASTGVYSIQQPTIQPLNNTRPFEESLLKWSASAGVGKGSLAADSWYDYLRSYWKNRLYSAVTHGLSFEDFWVDLLQNGVRSHSEMSENGSARSFRRASLSEVSSSQPGAELELVLYPTVALGDGSLANVPWLQELPDPVTRICWDNYVTVSMKTASELGLHAGQVVQVQTAGGAVEAPVHVQPGQADGVLGLAVGYGRTAAGEVGNGVGANAFQVVAYKNGRAVASGLSAKLSPVAGRKRVELANTQGHHSMQGPFDSKPRAIVNEATNEQYQHDASAGIHKHKIFSLWDKHEYSGHKWGMSIDLTKCTGCAACVVACQSENNIPVVGKKYVLQGRQMHWIRVDRYYVGEPEDPNSVFMPVMCQHCDNAPCETVCPVAATTHGSEGTNDMIYNRCVGTRYCANNCPYKVRRFNWFDYTNLRSPLHMALNPEVTVRSRGVMEKCTFCTHRIMQAKQTARNESRNLRDGDVQVACEQSCPTQAIVFGDMNDENSRVSKEFKNARTYSLLEELNNVPSVRYQTHIRNAKTLKGGHGHHEQGEHA